MQRTIQEHVLKNWEALTHSASKPRPLSTLQISKSHGKEYRWGRIVHLIFEEGSAEPVLAARFCRDRSYEGSLSREAGLMRELASTAIGDRVPRVLDSPTLGGRLVLFEEAARGVPMSVLAVNACHVLNEESFMGVVRSHLGKASAFLNALRAATSANKPVAGDGPLWDEMSAAAGKYCRMLGLRGTEEYSIYGLGRAAHDLLKGASSEFIVHGDFTPFNVFLQEDGSFKVIDWEFAGRGQLGFLDTMRFVYYYFQDIQSAGALGEDAFHETFVKGSGRLSPVFFEFARAAEGGLAKDAADFRTLLAFFLVHDASLQMEVTGAEFCDIGRVRERINNLTGYSSLREREELAGERDSLLAEKSALLSEREGLYAGINSLKGELAAVKGAEAELAKTVASMVNSKSWQLTYPLRWVSARLKGLHG